MLYDIIEYLCKIALFPLRTFGILELFQKFQLFGTVFHSKIPKKPNFRFGNSFQILQSRIFFIGGSLRRRITIGATAREK